MTQISFNLQDRSHPLNAVINPEAKLMPHPNDPQSLLCWSEIFITRLRNLFICLKRAVIVLSNEAAKLINYECA